MKKNPTLNKPGNTIINKVNRAGSIVKPLLGTRALHGCLVQALATLHRLPIGLWETAGAGSSISVPVTHIGDPGAVLGSWVHSGTIKAVRQ